MAYIDNIFQNNPTLSSIAGTAGKALSYLPGVTGGISRASGLSNYLQSVGGNYGSSSSTGSILGATAPTSSQNMSYANQSQAPVLPARQTTATTSPTLPSSNNLTANNLFTDNINTANQTSDAELAALNTGYDRAREDLLSNLSALESQRGSTLSSLDKELQSFTNQVNTSKEASRANTEKQIAEAGDTAKSVQDKNRNILRALGILNSSYAGEQLSNPMNEFAKQRADIMTLGKQRIDELDNFLNEKTNEHRTAVEQLLQQYTQLTNDIQRDLRFNERDRADAVQQARAALSVRLNEIKQAQANYAMQVEAQKQSLSTALTSMNDYTMPTNDLQAILSSLVNPQQGQQSNTASIYNNEKDKLSNIL